MAHVTGGGFIENIPRVLPEGADVVIEEGSWPVPPIFKVLREAGNVAHDDMFRTFNMGIGMVLIVPEEEAGRTIGRAQALGEGAYRIGTVTEGNRMVRFRGGGAR
jgi:phosphoribosylformylglycinamidine cyclo-ligase